VTQLPLLPPRNARAEAFREFHAANPAVYAALVRLARRARQRGSRVGLRCLWERLRWELSVETDTPREGEPYRLNNNHAPFYARLIARREPDLAGAFDLRGDGA